MPAKNEALINRIKELSEARLGEAYRITEKQARYEQIDAIKVDVCATVLAENSEDESITEGKIIDIIHELKVAVRSRILARAAY